MNAELRLQAISAIAITKSDTTTYISGTIYVGTAGDVNVVTVNGETTLFKNIGNASILPVRVKQVLSTSTTASDLVLLQ